MQKPIENKFSTWTEVEKKLMSRCLKRASSVQKKGEIPVAALIIDETGKIIAESGNIRERDQSVLGHCELVVLHRACKKKASWRLTGCTLFVTLEPCPMCAAAIMQARISRVVFAATDPKAGAFGSQLDLSKSTAVHHKIHLSPGLFAEESSNLIKKFFKKRRMEKKKDLQKSIKK
jgi:tRNA(adenine34) deaminase